jgi:ubiquinone/menaquinone biosynthesis C-methylase UbiE
MVKISKGQIYDRAYDEEQKCYEPTGGIIGFLGRRLARFSKSRYQVCYNLLPSEGNKFLDIGCGDGAFVILARRKYASCYGVDVSSVRIKRATKLLEEEHKLDGIHFSVCDVDEGLPFSDSFFDVVTVIAVLEHVLNPPNLLGEIHRILKPEGILILQVPNIAWIPHRIQLLAGRLPTSGGVYLGADWEHLHHFTKSVLSHLLRSMRFKTQIITCSGVFAGIRRRWVSALGGDLIVKSSKL